MRPRRPRLQNSSLHLRSIRDRTPRLRFPALRMLASLALATLGASPTITLNNGVIMPTVAAGTWQYTSDVAELSVSAALSAGFRHIDAAHDYCADGKTSDCSLHGGSNQQGIRKALAGSSVKRADLFITTKIPPCGAQGVSRDSCASDSISAAQKNLDELGVDYVDLLLIHFPPAGGCGPANCALLREQWKALAGVIAANKTRALGVSNFCISCFKCLEGANALVPAVNQVQYHIGMGPDPEGLFSYTKSKGIVSQAYSPLGDNTKELISGELVTSIGRAHNKSGVQVALKWIAQHGVAVTTKSSSAQHLKEDLDLFGWDLSDDEMTKADAATTPSGTPSFMCIA
ncbi:hypothetical protein AB1Y20_020596 [Prymnesium parvum]|uniref:NADP-dependent oxidoreductase domain-containing protein n=1 Tax=Prymnesium parvum TaxID=97485 RepID=A0AB34JY22_PRYPA